MAQTILYYPTINIQDGTWLRNAILYWDEVSSIVPYENYPDFSPELLYLQELGVYKAVYPRNLFFSEFAEDFCNSIVKRISAYELRTTNNGTQNSRVRMHKNKIYAPALHELIHYRKLPPQLLDYFGDRRYIHDYNTDGWMEIDSKIAQIYMRTLAEYSIKCSGKDIVLGTDTSTHSREIYNNSRNRADLQAQCCKINIENCNIYNADSPELIRHYEAQFIEGCQQCSDDFYKVLKESRITFFLSSFVSLVAIPFVGQLLSPHIGQELTSAIQAGAPLLNIGIGYFDYRNKISPAKADGGFSYIIKANRDGIIHI